MRDIEIREVHADDVPAVAALLRAVLAEFGLTFGEGSETDAQVPGPVPKVSRRGRNDPRRPAALPRLDGPTARLRHGALRCSLLASPARSDFRDRP